MNPAYLTASAALAGSVIGGLMTFCSGLDYAASAGESTVALAREDKTARAFTNNSLKKPFSVGPAVVAWLALSELMPTRIRSTGMGFALVLNQAVGTGIAAV